MDNYSEFNIKTVFCRCVFFCIQNLDYSFKLTIEHHSCTKKLLQEFRFFQLPRASAKEELMVCLFYFIYSASASFRELPQASAGLRKLPQAAWPVLRPLLRQAVRIRLQGEPQPLRDVERHHGQAQRRSGEVCEGSGAAREL